MAGDDIMRSNLKKRIRARKQKTGESYTTALGHVKAGEQGPVVSDVEQMSDSQADVPSRDVLDAGIAIGRSEVLSKFKAWLDGGGAPPLSVFKQQLFAWADSTNAEFLAEATKKARGTATREELLAKYLKLKEAFPEEGGVQPVGTGGAKYTEAKLPGPVTPWSEVITSLQARNSPSDNLIALGALRSNLNQFVAMIEDRPVGVCPDDAALLRALGAWADRCRRPT